MLKNSPLNFSLLHSFSLGEGSLKNVIVNNICSTKYLGLVDLCCDTQEITRWQQRDRENSSHLVAIQIFAAQLYNYCCYCYYFSQNVLR